MSLYLLFNTTKENFLHFYLFVRRLSYVGSHKNYILKRDLTFCPILSPFPLAYVNDPWSAQALGLTGYCPIFLPLLGEPNAPRLFAPSSVDLFAASGLLPSVIRLRLTLLEMVPTTYGTIPIIHIAEQFKQAIEK